jgi:hypothetical protein
VVGPLAELGFDGVDHRFQPVEVAVVQAETLCKLPNSFDRIQVRCGLAGRPRAGEFAQDLATAIAGSPD